MASGHQGAVLHYLHRLLSAGSVAGMGESQLLERFVARRDEAAFEALVARHGPMVLTVCRRVLHDEHDVEDAFQATFLVLVRRASSIQRQELLANWLYGVAHRVAVRARAQAARRRVVETDGIEADFAASAETSIRDDGPVVLEEVSRLPAHYRAVVVLCHLEGFSVEAAAQQLDCPTGTVKSRLARAREILRGRLARRGLAGSVGLVGAMLAEPTASAAVPAALIDATVRAAARVAAGQATAGVVSATVISLVEGVVKTMFLNKIKLAGAIALTFGFVVTGAGVMAFQTSGQRPGGGRGIDSIATDEKARTATEPAVKSPEVSQDPKAVVDGPSRRAVEANGGPPADPLVARNAMLLEDARDEVELLRIQLESKQAELEAALSRLDFQEKESTRLGELYKKGVSDHSQIDAAAAGLEQQKSRVQVKKVEVRELGLRLVQAERRLKHPEWLGLRSDRWAAGAPAADWERRIRALEQKVEQLSDEVSSLKRK